MGLALDEPEEGDRSEEIDGIQFVIAENDAQMILHHCPLQIDFTETGWRRGYRVTPGQSQQWC